LLTHRLTDRAELRPLEPWQAAEFSAHIQASLADFDEWLPFAAACAADVEAARSWLQDYADGQAADTRRLAGIWQDDVLVGGVLFRTFNARSGDAEIGVWLSPEARGQGLITLAAQHFIDWAFNVRGIHRIEWCNVPANTNSSSVAKRLGMTLEGVARESFPHHGVRYDTETWSLLTTDPR
jgi:RimJ/RimL family protein N-acetyltransferase